MNAFFEYHKNTIRPRYRCFDRPLLNGPIQPFQQPKRVIGFLNTNRDDSRVTRNQLGDIAEQYRSWVTNRSQKGDLAVLEAPDWIAVSSSTLTSASQARSVAAILRAREAARILVTKRQ
jgi:hypothetical protein